MRSFIADSPSGSVDALLPAMEAERVLIDLDQPGPLELLRRDVERIAAGMDAADRPPPMFWSGVPWPGGGSSSSSDYCLTISIGGTHTNYLLKRLRDGEVVALDPSGREVVGEERERLDETCRMPTPTHEDVGSGQEMIDRTVETICGYLRPMGDRLDRCRHILLSWGFPHRIVRRSETLLGGLTAIVTIMTKDQAPFTEDLQDKDLGRLFRDAFDRHLGWSVPITIANDTVMALHYFLSQENRDRYAQIALFINGTGANISLAEPYSVRAEGVVTGPGEVQYEPDRLAAGEGPRPGGRVVPYFVNYEAGSIELDATRTRFDLSEAYPIEMNALAGGNAFEQQFREFATCWLGRDVFQALTAAAASGPLGSDTIAGPQVSRLAQASPETVAELFPGAGIDASTAERIRAIARTVVARSALHAALILAAVTRRTRFGLGDPEGGRPDLLGMEGSVWRSPDYPELVRGFWQKLVGDAPLRVDFDHEESYDASSAGPLCMVALHES